MATICVFCGASGKMTAEHVLPNWLAGIGLTSQPAAGAASGWLNRSPQPRGPGKPFRTTVRAVCASCNNGWMSGLEQVARRVLTPMIRGEETVVSKDDQPVLAMWALKTTLVAMMVSSQEDRAQGYGLPPAEFVELHSQRDQRQPPDHVQVWLGRFDGKQHLASVQATPMIVTAQDAAKSDFPHAYMFSVLLGETFLQGIRFTTPSLGFDLTTEQGFTPIWPVRSDLDWPTGEAVTDDTLRRVQKGLNLRPVEPGLQLLPFRPAVDLPGSAAEGRMVRVPAPCGKHAVNYPAALVTEAMDRRFYAFMTMCECPKAYLVHTESDGAHFKAEGPLEAIEASYEALSGEEDLMEVPDGKFFYKHLRSS
jgi:hypothetical protein